MLTLWALAVASLTAGVVAYLVVLRWPILGATDAAHQVSERVERSAPSSFLRRRMDPQAATGLALTIAITVVVALGTGVGLLVVMVRSNTGLVRYDVAVANWGARHADVVSTDIIRTITWLGSTIVAVGLAVVVGIFVYRRTRQASVFLFLIVVVGGQNLIANLIKFAMDRARPAIGQLAGFSGSSFPSGHTTTAAACYAAFALLLGIGRKPTERAVLFGVAAAIAVAVGCSRILLGVHWFTDVLAGLALGWAWFAIGAIAFGGRLMVFGAPAERPRPRERIEASSPS
jgi:membrane-associated phospholipid phosphatase